MADRPPRGGDLSAPARAPGEHPFLRRPHRVFLGLALPVLISLIAEPLTALVDTAFIARLGSGPPAALNVATAVLSSVFWMFNLLLVGTQTEVAHADGAGDRERAQRLAGLAAALGAGLGAAIALLGWPAAPLVIDFMAPEFEVRDAAVTYLEIRLLGGPALLAMLGCFGALRGLQDMRSPLRIALGANALNLVLDAVLIFGLGPFPALGIAGAAWASTISQWLGAGWALTAVRRQLGLPSALRWREARALLVAGRDLFLRTALLCVFLVASTRSAAQAGMDAGAAHNAIRQVWLFTAFLLDAYAAAAQSLVGYFTAAGRAALALRVARVAFVWGSVTGVALAAILLGARDAVAHALVPKAAWGVFAGAWWIAAVAQPLNAVSFVSDGIHWGTRDYAYLRNAMLAATATGVALLLAIDPARPDALRLVWLVTVGWIAVRAVCGVARVWPGVGAAPLYRGSGARR